MRTSVKFAVTWTYREGEETVVRVLYHHDKAGCIEAARIIASSPYSSDINVFEVDTGISIPWRSPPPIGRVLYKEEEQKGA